MIRNPFVGRVVQCWYKPKVAAVIPIHGQVGTIVIAPRRPLKGELPAFPLPVNRKRDKKGRPIPMVPVTNPAVLIDGRLYVVPAGNLRPPR